MNNQEQKGLTCPNNVCKTLIPISYKELLVNTTVRCPKCRLKLDMNVPEEIKEHIKNISIAEAAVEKAKNFKG